MKQLESDGYEFYLKTPFGHVVSLDGDKMKVRNNFELRRGGKALECQLKMSATLSRAATVTSWR